MSVASGERPQVAIVGGGLAGLAAAAALAGAGIGVRLYESRRRLGGRAASFREPSHDTWVDHCQHVSMQCCTNLADFCRRTGLQQAFSRHRVLHFIGPDGRRYDFAGSRAWPAPLHLAGALWQLKYLSPGDRLGIARALHRLARLNDVRLLRTSTTGDWLRQQRQSPRAIEQFWELVLQSALGESVEFASLMYARKVFVDGFMAARGAYEVEIPTLPLGELYGARLQRWLSEQGVELRLSTAVQQVELQAGRAVAVRLRPHETATSRRTSPAMLVREPSGGVDLAVHAGHDAGGDLGDSREKFPREPCDLVIVAAPWRHVPGLFDAADLESLPSVQRLKGIQSSPISAVHLWFDRAITDLPHAVLVGRLSQWVFRRPASEWAGESVGADTQTPLPSDPPSPATQGADRSAGSAGASPQAPHAVHDPGVHYYQVVISASRSLQGRPREAVVAEVVDDMKAAFPEAQRATLVAAKVVTDPHAVFSVRPGIDTLRPSQRTEIDNLFLAGDWTQTHWPATMEGAVRSGYLAAEAVLDAIGRREPVLVSELKPGWLARCLIRPVRESPT